MSGKLQAEEVVTVWDTNFIPQLYQILIGMGFVITTYPKSYFFIAVAN